MFNQERKERIQLSDNLISAIAKMVDGNPGAMVSCMDIVKNGEKIDPDNIMGGFGNILSLDSYGIYGTDIYILHNDICNREVAKVITILRAVQLGFFSSRALADACSRQDRSGREMIDIKDLYKKVKEQLPNFDPEGQVIFEEETEANE